MAEPPREFELSAEPEPVDTGVKLGQVADENGVENMGTIPSWKGQVPLSESIRAVSSHRWTPAAFQMAIAAVQRLETQLETSKLEANKARTDAEECYKQFRDERELRILAESKLQSARTSSGLKDILLVIGSILLSAGLGIYIAPAGSIPVPFALGHIFSILGAMCIFATRWDRK